MISSTTVSWQSEAKEYDKATPQNKPQTRDLLERNAELQLSLSRNRENTGLLKGSGCSRVFEAYSVSWQK